MSVQLWFKRKTIPATNETLDIDVVQLWEVRWWSRHGDRLMGDEPRYVTARREMECFTSAEQAEDFAQSLRQAFKVLKYTGAGLGVEVIKAK